MERHRSLVTGDRTRFQRLKAVGLACTAMTLATAPTFENPKLLQNAHASIKAGQNILVATANVHSWEDPRGGSNNGAFIDFIDRVNPDVVCGEEAILSTGFPRSEFSDRGYSIITAPTRLLPFFDSGSYGNFLLSKFKVVDFEVRDLPSDIDLSDPLKLVRPRVLIHAKLAKEDGTTFDVVCTHLEGVEPDNTMQLNYLKAYIGGLEVDESVVLLGDVNDSSFLYEQLPGVSAPPKDELPTVPADNPTKKIDAIRVFQAGNTAAVDYSTHSIDSDHLALTAVIDRE